jgi:Ca-activated chloride channel family protein
MNWFREFGLLETLAVLWFLTAYGLLFWRYIKISKSLKVVFRYLRSKFFIRAVYFSLIVIALLGPSFGETEKEVKTSGKDIIFVVDLSHSMDAIDVMPTRLDKVKFELKRITDSFAGDRVGIIIFSSDAFMQCPLTNDPSAVNLFIETLNTKLVPRGSTDMSPALRMALEKHLSEEETVKKTSKIIVLISDGEDFGKETDEVADEIKKSGIRLFTVGVGTEQGGKIKMPDGRFKLNNGQEVITQMNPEFLQDLAKKTDGQFFLISDKVNDTGRLINAIAQIEGEVRGVKKTDVSANKYHYFLWFALFLIVIDFLIVLNVIEI